MTTDWDGIIVESLVLAVIIFGAMFTEHWNYRRIQKKQENSDRNKILLLIKEDLTRKMRFINESITYKKQLIIFRGNCFLPKSFKLNSISWISLPPLVFDNWSKHCPHFRNVFSMPL